LTILRTRTHGLTGTATYKIWSGIKKRCFQKNAEVYAKYGARGISMCPTWQKSFNQFLLDMGPRPEGLTIERKDNNGNYEPGNCIWTTPLAQASNKRNTVCGRAGESLAQTARREGVSYKYLHKLFRIKKFTIEAAIICAKIAAQKHDRR
jgi:hypothetical protein